jgi:HAD superfamily hydrolase (TIGR01490 family)
MKPICAAVFDLDGTILRKPSSEKVFFAFLLSKKLISVRNIGYLLYGVIKGANNGFIPATKGNKYLYRNMEKSVIREKAKECFQLKMKKNIFQAAVECINEHKKNRRLIVLLTGTLDFLLDPFMEFLEADIGISTKLEVCDGRFTGKIDGVHPFGINKNIALAPVLEASCIRPELSWGYGDHHTDAFFLSKLGNPVAINPDRKLTRYANKKGWEIRYW